MPQAPAAGTAGTAAPVGGGGPLSEGSLNLTPAASTSGQGQALLVSSAPARAATAANVTKLQTVTAPAATPATTTTTPANNTTTPANTTTTTSTPTPSVLPQTSTTTQSPTQTTTSPAPYTPPQGATQVSLPGGATGYYTAANGTNPETMTDANGNPLTYSQSVGGWIDPSTGAAPVQAPVSPTSSTGTATNPYAAAVSSISDQGVAAEFSSALATQDQEAQTLQATITSLQGATAATDPSTMAAVAAIQVKYNALIQAMQAKNTQIIGRASTESAAFGGLGVQAGAGIDGTFMSNETSDAQQRIDTLQGEEQSAILAAQAAFSTNNAKALSDAMTQYDTVNSQKMTALNDLLTAMNKQVTDAQAQQKIDLTSTKDQVSNDIAQSTKIAAGIASNISAAGLTDPADIQAYIQGIAAQYGISNPDILYSQVVTAGQTLQKTATGIANTQDEITNRDTGTTIKEENVAISASKAATGTVAQQKQTALASIGQLATPGVTDSNGVPYVIAAKDGNDYLTKQGFATLYDAATNDGIARADFLAAVQSKLQPGQATAYGLSTAEATRLGI